MINQFYANYATQFMTIDENENGLYCQVPSESNGESYIAQVDESGVCPIVSSCSCKGFRYHGHCKHEVIVNNFYTKLYASNIAKAEEKALEAAIDAEEAIEEAYAMAEIADAIVAKPVKKVCGFEAALNKPRRQYVTAMLEKQQHYGKVKAQMRKYAPLNGSRKFSLMR